MVTEDSSKVRSLPHLLKACLVAVSDGRLPSVYLLKATISKVRVACDLVSLRSL